MAEQLRDAGRDPLTWAFARLLGRQLRRDVRELPGLPASHAWRPLAPPAAAPSQPRVLTKARCLGVVVSVLPRPDRVEFLVDDGTGLIKAVLWGASNRADVALGDLVEVEGKLNANTSLDGADPAHPRELRVIRLSTVGDPNEEALHWAQVIELTCSCYLSGNSATKREETAVAAVAAAAPCAPRGQWQSPSIDERWERVGREAFFHRRVSRASASSAVGGGRDDQRGRVLLDVLERLLRRQEETLASDGAEQRAVRVTFSAALDGLSASSQQTPTTEFDRRTAVRDLRFAFHTMRCMGLLVLEDEETDRHEMLSYELALRPAIAQVVAGASVTDVVDALTARARFRRVPLEWIEQGIGQAIEDGVVRQQPDSQLVCLVEARSPALQAGGGQKGE